MSSVATKPNLGVIPYSSCPIIPLRVGTLHQPRTRRFHTTPQLPSSPQQTSLYETKQIHAHFIRTQFCNPFLLKPSLSTLYNFIITCYIKNNSPEEALTVYLHMRSMETQVDEFIVPSILKACAESRDSWRGREIHGFVTKSGLSLDVFVQNSLMQMYCECGLIGSARKVFDKMPERDVVSWSTIVDGYNNNRCFDEALDIIREMYTAGIRPSQVTMINMVNLFAGIGDLGMAKAMHGCVMKNSINGSPDRLSTNTALIDMYAKCGSVDPARRLFDELPQRSIVPFTAMIGGYIHSGNIYKGLELFQYMQNEDVFPNEVTMLSMLIEAGNTATIELGKWVHVYMIKMGFNMSVVLVTALLDMYAKCGDSQTARSLFDKMNYKDLMSWTAMISGFAKAGHLNQAYDLFREMHNARIKPNHVILTSLLSLCANAGALDIGNQVHTCIDELGFSGDMVLNTALLDMFAKCGDLHKAEEVFAKATDRDICMWNAMMSGFAMHGRGEKALNLFHRMKGAGLRPSDVTFIALLHVCSHAGLLAEGHEIFSCMRNEFGLSPKIEHYGCMVDLLARVGRLDEAYDLIKSMPYRPNLVIWGALLAGCKLYRNPQLGEIAAKELVSLEPSNCGYHVLLSNIYATTNRWNDVAEVRRRLKDEGIKKEPGFSSIEVNGSIHRFVMGDDTHPQAKAIHEMLAKMNKKLKGAGYVANTSVVLLNVDEEDKELALANHSERLAMAFGLISTTPNDPIRIVKNLRVCDDCHSATKLISKIYNRVIVVRDRNRFHHFRDGLCSCGDFW